MWRGGGKLYQSGIQFDRHSTTQSVGNMTSSFRFLRYLSEGGLINARNLSARFEVYLGYFEAASLLG